MLTRRVNRGHFLSMNFILQLFQIIAFKRKPQDISYDVNSAFIIFFCYTASTFFNLQIAGLLPAPLMFAIAQTIIQALLYFLILCIYKKQTRFVQMTSALFGANTILQIIALLLAATPLIILGLYLSLWALVISIYILRETVERKTSEAILVSLGLHFVMAIILINLFPEFYQALLASIEQANTK